MCYGMAAGVCGTSFCSWDEVPLWQLETPGMTRQETFPQVPEVLLRTSTPLTHRLWCREDINDRKLEDAGKPELSRPEVGIKLVNLAGARTTALLLTMCPIALPPHKFFSPNQVPVDLYVREEKLLQCTTLLQHYIYLKLWVTTISIPMTIPTGQRKLTGQSQAGLLI